MDMDGNDATGNPDDERALIEKHKSSPFYSDGYFAGLNGDPARQDTLSYAVGYRAGQRARVLFASHGMTSTGRNSFGGRVA